MPTEAADVSRALMLCNAVLAGHVTPVRVSAVLPERPDATVREVPLMPTEAADVSRALMLCNAVLAEHVTPVRVSAVLPGRPDATVREVPPMPTEAADVSRVRRHPIVLTEMNAGITPVSRG